MPSSSSELRNAARTWIEAKGIVQSFRLPSDEERRIASTRLSAARYREHEAGAALGRTARLQKRLRIGTAASMAGVFAFSLLVGSVLVIPTPPAILAEAFSQIAGLLMVQIAGLATQVVASPKVERRSATYALQQVHARAEIDHLTEVVKRHAEQTHGTQSVEAFKAAAHERSTFLAFEKLTYEALDDPHVRAAATSIDPRTLPYWKAATWERFARLTSAGLETATAIAPAPESPWSRQANSAQVPATGLGG
jgi:hypothetical protein